MSRMPPAFWPKAKPKCCEIGQISLAQLAIAMMRRQWIGEFGRRIR
jgi:hypothetical protein